MSTILFEEIQLEIISSAIDDIHGLYEILWALNSSHPDLTQVEKLNKSKLAIKILISNDIINIYHCYWGKKSTEKILKNDALIVIAEDKNWNVPQSFDGQYYGFYSSGQKCLDEERRLYEQINRNL